MVCITGTIGTSKNLATFRYALLCVRPMNFWPIRQTLIVCLAIEELPREKEITLRMSGSSVIADTGQSTARRQSGNEAREELPLPIVVAVEPVLESVRKCLNRCSSWPTLRH